jgi:hypothetical protein
MAGDAGVIALERLPTMNTMNPTQKKQLTVSILLLFVVLVTVCPTRAQSKIGLIAPKSGKTVQSLTEQGSIHATVKLGETRPVVVRASEGELILNLTKSDFPPYDSGVQNTIEGFGNRSAPLSAAMPRTPPSATPPGILGLPPIPGTAQTPTTEALRDGNVDLGALAAWVVTHISARR